MDSQEMIVSKQRALEQRLTNDWRRILNMPEGRRVVWNLLQVAHFRQHGFVPGDPSATAFHCGQISIALYMADKVAHANFSALEQMEQEFLAERKQIQTDINNNAEDL